MAKHWSFHVQSCLGMVWNLFENLDFRTILTHSDLRKGTLTNFGHFDSQNWVTDKDHPELLSHNIPCADRFKPKHRTIQKKNVQCPMSNVQCPIGPNIVEWCIKRSSSRSWKRTPHPILRGFRARFRRYWNFQKWPKSTSKVGWVKNPTFQEGLKAFPNMIGHVMGYF